MLATAELQKESVGVDMTRACVMRHETVRRDCTLSMRNAHFDVSPCEHASCTGYLIVFHRQNKLRKVWHYMMNSWISFQLLLKNYIY